MTVQRILGTKGNKVVTATPDTTIANVCKILKAERIGAVVVSKDGKHVAGILSERDIVRAIADRGSAVLEAKAEELMTREVQTCSRKDKVQDVMGRMSQQRFRHLPVLENGELVGIISIGDVVKVRLEEVEHEAEALRSYITQ